MLEYHKGSGSGSRRSRERCQGEKRKWEGGTGWGQMKVSAGEVQGWGLAPWILCCPLGKGAFLLSDRCFVF